MKPKSLEIFIPGPAGRLEAKYYKNPKFGSPVAIVLQPHPQYGSTRFVLSGRWIRPFLLQKPDRLLPDGYGWR